MPHSPADKKRALARLRRIQGQADALARALEAGSDCGPVLQQLAAMRGAVNGLMAEVLESHLRETFDAPAAGGAPERAIDKGTKKSAGQAAAKTAAKTAPKTAAKRSNAAASREAGVQQAIALVRSYLR